MHVIGLTGGIGSGKTTVAEHLAQLGFYIINADTLGHEAYKQGSTSYVQIVDHFGHEIVAQDGSIDRKVLGQIVFHDRDKLIDLTDIVWPIINELATERIEALRRDGKENFLCFEAAVLIEAKWTHLVDTVWSVVVSPETAIERVSIRDGLPRQQIECRLRAQISNEERIAVSDAHFENEGSKTDLLEQVAIEFRKIQNRNS